MRIKVEGLLKNGITVEFDLPGKRIVCPRCEGAGKHANPAVDGHGISPEEFAEDPDFEEAYFSGVYDVRCEECDGHNVVEVVDNEACRAPKDKKNLVRYLRNEDAKAAWEREKRTTLYWESGGTMGSRY